MLCRVSSVFVFVWAAIELRVTNVTCHFSIALSIAQNVELPSLSTTPWPPWLVLTLDAASQGPPPHPRPRLISLPHRVTFGLLRTMPRRREFLTLRSPLVITATGSMNRSICLLSSLFPLNIPLLMRHFQTLSHLSRPHRVYLSSSKPPAIFATVDPQQLHRNGEINSEICHNSRHSYYPPCGTRLTV